ncbi:MAG: hypothetical protein WC710_15100 [Gallionella sp.]|jgi:hypothetical protein
MSTWDEFCEHRKELRRPVTKVGAKRLLAKLEKFAAEGQDVDAIMVRSIENGWVGLFPLPPELAAKPASLKQRASEAWIEVRAAVRAGQWKTWSDVLTAPAITACGGWMSLADMRTDQASFMERRFVQEFCTLQKAAA